MRLVIILKIKCIDKGNWAECLGEKEKKIKERIKRNIDGWTFFYTILIFFRKLLKLMNSNIRLE